jgi:predicted DNA-binding ribbon-helix-helix protein
MGVGGREGMTRADKKRLRSMIIKRSIVINDHKTSVTLEEEFWEALKEMATLRGTTIKALVSAIDLKRDHSNLSSAVRPFVLDFYRKQLPPLE